MKNINIHDYVKTEDNINLIVNMLLHLQKSENALKWKQEAYNKRCKEMETLKEEINLIVDNNKKYIK